MVLGFGIFAKLYSRPEKWVFEHRWAIFTKFGEILRWLPSLNGHSLAPWGAIVLGPFSTASQCQTDYLGLLNFCKTPLQAWEMSVWTKTSNFHQIWRNSTDGCPLWTAVAQPPEVQLTWVLFLWLANAQLMIWGFWIFAKLHSRPEKWAFEQRRAIFTKIGEIPQTVALFERP